MRYRFLLFDADNTLFDFSESERIAFSETLCDCGISETPDMLPAYSRGNIACWEEFESGLITKEELLVKRFALFAARFCPEKDPAKLNDVYTGHLGEVGVLLPGALEMVKRLKEAGARVYIVTNGLEKVQRGRFAGCELMEYVDGVFISECLGANKPDRLFFERAAAQIEGFDKSRAVVIGDSPTGDIRGANNFGVDCVWYNPEGRPAPQDMKIDKTVANFDEMESFLKGVDA